MKNMKFLVLAAVALSISAVVSGCGGHKVKLDSNNEVVVPGVVSVSTNWLKDKKDKFDFELVVTNKNLDTGIIIFLSSMSCGRGEVKGTLKHTFFNTGERTIDFKPNEAKTFRMVCNLGTKTKGDFKVNLGKIWDNPSLDGKTTGKGLADDAAWIQKD